MDDESRGRRPSGFAEAQLAERMARGLIGMDEADAVSAVEEAGLAVRIAQRDGTRLMLTTDLRPNRINLAIQNGRVSAAEMG